MRRRVLSPWLLWSPWAALLLQLVMAGAAAAASGGSDFPIMRR